MKLIREDERMLYILAIMIVVGMALTLAVAITYMSSQVPP
ncbi:hypothetical protein ES703_108061 [subsurface metagenome]